MPVLSLVFVLGSTCVVHISSIMSFSGRSTKIWQSNGLRIISSLSEFERLPRHGILLIHSFFHSLLIHSFIVAKLWHYNLK